MSDAAPHWWKAETLEVKNTKGKGRGVYAVGDFKKGQLLLTEKPILNDTVDNILKTTLLDSPVFDLYSPPTELTQPTDTANKRQQLSNIINYNSFGDSADYNTVKVYLQHSLFNHSCDPNAKHRGNDIFAERDIFAGEEITISYICPQELKLKLKARNRELKTWFSCCECVKCNNERAASAAKNKLCIEPTSNSSNPGTSNNSNNSIQSVDVDLDVDAVSAAVEAWKLPGEVLLCQVY